jgi:threonine/homoserine/homoserine lactone efflux protein
MVVTFILGLVFGFVGSMPVAGPISILVFESGLDARSRDGLSLALGSALAESIYAGMAFLGLTAVLQKFPLLVPASRVLGALILIALGGYFVLLRPPARKKEKPRLAHEGSRFIVGFTLTILNPTLIATWSAATAVLHSSGLVRVREIDAIPFGVGVGLGILGWFATLINLLGRFRSRFSQHTLDRMVRAAGWLLLVTGLGLALRLVLQWPSVERHL